MGVDAQMCFILKEPLSKDEVRQLAMDCFEAFGSGMMMAYGNRKHPEKNQKGPLEELLKLGRRAHHCITATDEFTQDGDSIFPGEGEYLYEVHMWCRYYGIGYERGPLDRILSVARWFRTRLPEARIYYGGDSSGCVADEFTPEFEQELWAHFCDQGGKPYGGRFGGMFRGDGCKTPVCKLCKVPYIRYGGGGGGQYASFRCDGCGHHIQTHDGGKSWTRSSH